MTRLSYLSKSGHRFTESDVQSRIILGQLFNLIERYQFGNRSKHGRLGKSKLAFGVDHSDEFVGASLPHCESVLSFFSRRIANKEGTIISVSKKASNFFPGVCVLCVYVWIEFSNSAVVGHLWDVHCTTHNWYFVTHYLFRDIPCAIMLSQQAKFEL